MTSAMTFGIPQAKLFSSLSERGGAEAYDGAFADRSGRPAGRTSAKQAIGSDSSACIFSKTSTVRFVIF
jgi:hypothetical protein